MGSEHATRPGRGRTELEALSVRVLSGRGIGGDVCELDHGVIQSKRSVYVNRDGTVYAAR